MVQFILTLILKKVLALEFPNEKIASPRAFKKSISIIYYVNNSDGDTFFFDKKLNTVKRISPRQGRAVVFNSNMRHAACCPINSVYRQVINFVLHK